MRLLVLSVGRASKGPERALIERYLKRIQPLARAQGFKSCDIQFLNESGKDSAEARMREEAEKLQKIIPAGAVIALDEKGSAISSQDFSTLLQELRDQGLPALTFIIGGPDGLDASLKKKSDKTIALGSMTWPHQLACAMLMEQIYRGLTIMSGHPYHRG